MILTPGTFAHGTTFLVGSEKHAGKTTLLNYLVRMLRPTCPPAYLSIGVDGESTDTLGGFTKPLVHTEAGDWIVTAESALTRSGLSVEIHEVFPFNGVMGRPVLAHVIRAGAVELLGPGENAHLSWILDYLMGVNGITGILVDGSINRITQLSAGTEPACAYVVRANRGNLPRVIELLRRLSLLQHLPLATDGVYIDGALTSDVAAGLPDSPRLVVDNLSCVFLSYAELVTLQRRTKLTCRRQIELRACFVNLHDISQQEFLDRLAGDAIAERIAFNPYQEAA